MSKKKYREYRVEDRTEKALEELIKPTIPAPEPELVATPPVTKEVKTIYYHCPKCDFEMHLTNTMIEIDDLVECGCGYRFRAGILKDRL